MELDTVILQKPYPPNTFRTKLDMTHALYLYFNGLSLGNTSKALTKFVTRSHAAIRVGFKGTNMEDCFSGMSRCLNL
jgi:uncharacterized Fe-S cluster-containing radical SAM superfamily protein